MIPMSDRVSISKGKAIPLQAIGGGMAKRGTIEIGRSALPSVAGLKIRKLAGVLIA
jgi:hypothetical protein